MQEERDQRLNLAVDVADVLPKIEQSEPFEAVNIVVSYPVMVALSIIDNLDPPLGAFALALIRAKRNANDDSLDCNQEYAVSLCDKATTLKVRGCRGWLQTSADMIRESGTNVG